MAASWRQAQSKNQVNYLIKQAASTGWVTCVGEQPPSDTDITMLGAHNRGTSCGQRHSADATGVRTSSTGRSSVTTGL